jgi:hypothetical protein
VNKKHATLPFTLCVGESVSSILGTFSVALDSTLKIATKQIELASASEQAFTHCSDALKAIIQCNFPFYN